MFENHPKSLIFYLRTPSGDNSLKQPIASLKSKKPFDEPSKNFKKKRFFDIFGAKIQIFCTYIAVLDYWSPSGLKKSKEEDK